jgi:hypothetical protein
MRACCDEKTAKSDGFVSSFIAETSILLLRRFFHGGYVSITEHVKIVVLRILPGKDYTWLRSSLLRTRPELCSRLRRYLFYLPIVLEIKSIMKET